MEHPAFTPPRPPGLHLPNTRTRDERRTYLSPITIFKLFFTAELVASICHFTNAYASMHIAEHPSYQNGDGEWEPLKPEEFYRFLGLLIYFGFVRVPNVDKFFSTSTLYHGLWARHFLSYRRYLGIMCFLKVSDPVQEQQQLELLRENPQHQRDPLIKVRHLLDSINNTCQLLYQPSREISIDERMVRNKGRFRFRQYIKDKPTKWGFKLWVLACSCCGYTYNFDVYTGRNATAVKSGFGLGYDVVMQLCTNLKNFGYHLFVDNFYTSVRLFLDLFRDKVLCCGTMRQNRQGVPEQVRQADWAKKGKRGDMRFVREGPVGFFQWKDNKVVTVASTIHNNAGHSVASRRVKDGRGFRKIKVRQPKAIAEYNQFMLGVDRSDQLIGKYNVLRKCHKWWKTLFFHMLDISVVNSYILFMKWRQLNSDFPELSRSNKYNQLSFREELCRELGELPKSSTLFPIPSAFVHQPVRVGPCNMLVPEYTNVRRRCKKCTKYGKDNKTFVKCSTCDSYYCFSKDRNCLSTSHVQ